MVDFHARTVSLVRSWPRASANQVRNYLRAHAVQGRPGKHGPPWLLLPAWLHDRFPPPRHGARPSHRFLSDVLWGQFCLFLFVRMQDDVLDGQAPPGILFVADEFLVESHRAFNAHVRLPAFQSVLLASIRSTVRGILRANAMQRGRGPAPRQWSVYAEVGSIFKVGSAAVCLPRGRHREFAAVSRLMDHLCIADQLVDDLRDLDEDLKDRRINAAARWLTGKTMAGETRAVIGAAMFHTNRVEQLVARVNAHVQAARAIAGGLKLTAARSYFLAYDHHLARVLQRVHLARVEALRRQLLE